MRSSVILLSALLASMEAGCSSRRHLFIEPNRSSYGLGWDLNEQDCQWHREVSVSVMERENGAGRVALNDTLQVSGLRGRGRRFRTENFGADVPASVMRAFFSRPVIQQLQSVADDKLPSDGSGAFGCVVLRGRMWFLHSEPANGFAGQLHEAFLDLAREARLGEDDREINYLKLEGDDQPVRRVELRDLAASPRTFDGKRVRVRGYYHSEFEMSQLTKSADWRRGITIHVLGPSSFAPAVQWPNDAWVELDGCFQANDRTIHRITRAQVIAGVRQ